MYTDEILDKALIKMANDNPGSDLIAGIWIKNMQSVREMLEGNLRSVLNNHQDLPDWSVTAKAILVLTLFGPSCLRVQRGVFRDPKNLKKHQRWPNETLHSYSAT